MGNGFDLASGLPTKYTDYFMDFNYSNQISLSKLEKIIFVGEENHKNKGSISDNNENVTKSIDVKRIKPKAGDVSKFQELNTMVLSSYLNLIESSSIIDELIKENVSVWNLLFWFNGFDNDNEYEWSEIEAQIALILEFSDNNSPLYFSEINLMETSVELKAIHLKLSDPESTFKNSDSPNSSKTVVKNLKVYERLRILILELLKKRYESHNTGNKFSIFKSELELLENNFRKYIKNIYEENVLNRSGALIYRDNLSKLIDPLIENCYILNFNYTDLSLKKVSNKFSFEKNKIKYNVIQNNVHGVYYDKIIFGIDQKGISTQNPKYVFSKTYRKLETILENQNTPLPLKTEVKTISFYGHSFSEADYSYFRSIFDYYDLYNSSIKLKFYYSNYKKSDSTRSEVTSTIFNLLESYAESMYSGNQQISENLLHKLILEDRIKVEKISLRNVITQ